MTDTAEGEVRNFRYRKKPVVIEAFQVTPESIETMIGWPAWMLDAWAKKPGDMGALWGEDGPQVLDNMPAEDISHWYLMVGTVDGAKPVPWRHYLVQGVKGELCTCDPGIFAATYEREQPAEQAA